MRAIKVFNLVLKQKLVFCIDEEHISNPGVLQRWIKSYDLYYYLKKELVDYQINGEKEKAYLLHYVLMAGVGQTISEMKYNEARIDCYGSAPHLWIRGKVDFPGNDQSRDSEFYFRVK